MTTPTDNAGLLPVPTAGLIASMQSRVWVDTTPTGTDIYGVILITHPPAGDPAEVERLMRGAAAALGLAPSPALIPDVGARISVHDRGETRLRFDGTDYQLRLTVPGHYGATLTALGRGLLAVGLDPLDRYSTPVEVDAYISRTTRAGRMLCGSARVTP